MNIITREVQRGLDAVDVLTKFYLKHQSWLDKNEPDLVFMSGPMPPSVHYHGKRAKIVAAYFGNDGWTIPHSDSREKEVDGVRVTVFDQENRQPKFNLVNPAHLDCVGSSGCKAAVETFGCHSPPGVEIAGINPSVSDYSEEARYHMNGVPMNWAME